MVQHQVFKSRVCEAPCASRALESVGLIMVGGPGVPSLIYGTLLEVACLPFHRHCRWYLYHQQHHHLQPYIIYVMLSYVCNYNILCELCPIHWRTETIIADNLLTKRCKTCPIKLRGGTIMKRVNRLKKGLRALEQVELSTLCGPGSREMMTSRAFSPSPPGPSGHSLILVKIIILFNLIYI